MILSVEQIIDAGIVENDRIEYKAGWNPEAIIHTLCAFANDIENQGGGYIIIGIEESSGRPKNIIGVDADSVDKMNKDLLNLCHQIDPRYLVDSAYEIYDNKGLFIIKAPGGGDRPYKCPVSLSQKKGEKGYYIRKLGSTIRARSSDERNLFEISKIVPFDDRLNMVATVSDLDRGLMTQYLDDVRSRAETEYSNDLAEMLHVVGGPSEDRRPVNVGLMFFNLHPDDYFREAKINIVYKPDETGHGMVEHTVTGPLNMQLRLAASIIQSRYIEEYVTKVEDRPEAERRFNYPLEAVEEALSNAIYHKAYDIPEPVTVYIFQDRMEITSIPGPDRSISDEDLEAGVLVAKQYRNRRIGEFLKDLRLVEGRNTGIPLMKEALRRNGSAMPRFITDQDRSFMTVVISAKQAFSSKATSTDVIPEHPEHWRRSSEDIARQVVEILRERGDMSVRELSDAMGYKAPPSSLRKMISILMAAGTLEYTEPESIRSPTQRIRLVSH